MKKLLPLPPTFNPDTHDAGHLHRWLVSLGVDVGGVTLLRPFKATGDNTLFVDVHTEADLPDTIFDAYVPELTETEQAAQELASIDFESADLDEMRKALGLMKQLMDARDTAGT